MLTFQAHLISLICQFWYYVYRLMTLACLPGLVRLIRLGTYFIISQLVTHFGWCLTCEYLSDYTRWTEANKERLRQQNSSLQFKLHRLRFIELASQGPPQQLAALLYARNFEPFASAHAKGKEGGGCIRGCRILYFYGVRSYILDTDTPPPPPR